jgi:hypothetical protein
MGTPNNVVAGPGLLYVAPAATTLPTDAATALGTSFVPVGYTEEGSTFSYAITREDLWVAEEVSPVKSYTTKVDTMVKFSMAEATVLNLLLALNQGVVASATDVSAPAAGSEVYVVLVLQATSGARWVFPQCIQTGNVEIAHKKAPAKTLIPVEFKLYLPTSGPLFICYPGANGLI